MFVVKGKYYYIMQCSTCQIEFPSSVSVNGKRYFFNKRKQCLACLPSAKFGNTFPEPVHIHKSSSSKSFIPNKLFCLECSKELIGNQIRYCSTKCRRNYRFGVGTKVYQKKRELRKLKEANLKIKLVETFGGCCKTCGYDKNYSALEFHHIDPLTKKYSLRSNTLIRLDWNSCIEEARKCILMCSNCHKEHHYPQHNKVVS